MGIAHTHSQNHVACFGLSNNVGSFGFLPRSKSEMFHFRRESANKSIHFLCNKFHFGMLQAHQRNLCEFVVRNNLRCHRAIDQSCFPV